MTSILLGVAISDPGHNTTVLWYSDFVGIEGTFKWTWGNFVPRIKCEGFPVGISY